MDENNTSIDGDFNGQLANGNITNTFNYPDVSDLARRSKADQAER
jgi:hypothetical protein